MPPRFVLPQLGRAAIFAAVVPVCLLVRPRSLVAQDPSGQLWGDLEFVWPRHDAAWLFATDLKPEIQFSGDDRWAELEVETSAVYRGPRLFDLSGDVSVGYSVQNDDVETLELAPRVGITVHLISDVTDIRRAGQLAQRVGLATTVRLENRNFWYFGSGATQSYSNDWRLRFRVETRIGINRADRTQPGTWFLYADAEAFVTLGEANQETYAEKWQIRVGPGLRFTEGWRFGLLYVRDVTRNTIQSDYDTSVNAVELRATRYLGLNGGK
ncbi:MAG: DUF2490 domain-containing protein [Gemmatimonadota bacterium]